MSGALPSAPCPALPTPPLLLLLCLLQVMEGLKLKQEELEKLMRELATLEKRLSNSMEEKERLEAEVRLRRAGPFVPAGRA